MVRQRPYKPTQVGSIPSRATTLWYKKFVSVQGTVWIHKPGWPGIVGRTAHSSPGLTTSFGRLAQWESIPLSRERSRVQSPQRSPYFAAVAQTGERCSRKAQVAGIVGRMAHSTPARRSIRGAVGLTGKALDS